MKLAIMQPYFFPYLGYWQLIHAVDRFVIYDDVNYIKGGWINRNRILINGRPAYITVPLHRPSSFKRICDTTLQPSTSWREREVRMVEVTYRKAPGFAVVFPVLERLIRHETDNLPDYLAHQLRTLSAFMGIGTEFVSSSRCYANGNLSRQARLLDICSREGATIYINPAGGQHLYDPCAFRACGIDLRFIVMRCNPYRQRAKAFVPDLSIIDALMEIGPIETRNYLDAYHLVERTGSRHGGERGIAC
jgi:hypothetical protein